jgi:HAD superfamily hydrolase (TIGR01549 family)
MRNKTMIKAVVFDVDGTIVDSVDLHAQAWQEAFKKFGKEVDLNAVRRQIGKGADQLLPVFFSKRELDEFGANLDEYRGALFKKKYMPRVEAFPKVRDLFERIRQDGKRIALASSAKEDELATYKKIARIEDLLEAETSSDDAERSKPHADIFEAALEKLAGITAKETIVVGDTPYDAEAAAKVQLMTVGLLGGGWQEKELRQAGCVAVYRDPADLLDHYAESPIVQTGNFNL